MVQVGKAAVDQPANEIDRQRLAVVAFQQIGRPRRALFRGEAGPVDKRAAIAGQCEAVAGFRLATIAAWRIARRMRPTRTRACGSRR